MYTYKEYRRAKVIQTGARQLFIRQRERDRLLEEYKNKLKEEARENYLKEIKLGMKNAIKLRVDLRSRNYSSVATQRMKMIGTQEDLELEVPVHLRLTPCYLASGVWGVLQSENKKSLQIVVLFKIGDGGSTCDVRDVHGVLEKRIKTTRIFQISWPPGENNFYHLLSYQYFELFRS